MQRVYGILPRDHWASVRQVLSGPESPANRKLILLQQTASRLRHTLRQCPPSRLRVCLSWSNYGLARLMRPCHRRIRLRLTMVHHGATECTEYRNTNAAKCLFAVSVRSVALWLISAEFPPRRHCQLAATAAVSRQPAEHRGYRGGVRAVPDGYRRTPLIRLNLPAVCCNVV